MGYTETLKMTDLTPITDNSTFRMVEILDYLRQLPGLQQAIEIGRQAVVHRYLTVAEMCGTLSLQISLLQMELIDNAMATVAAVLTLEPQSYRVSTVGGCSYEQREYPGSLFPFFLNVLSSQGFSYDA